MTTFDFAALRQRIDHTRLSERLRLSREWQRLRAQQQQGRNVAELIPKLAARIDSAVARVEQLRALPLKLNYDADLPITAHRNEILEVLARHQVIVLCGATGSGKSTQLPKFCLEAGRGIFGVIGHTQPRRIAARALANRLAEEMATNVGDAVGYQVRFTDRTGPHCRVKLMTDGILLRELEADRDLRAYDTLIIDEAHERSLNIDLLLGVLRQLVARRADLKLIITSATIDPQKFSRFFNDAPIIEVSGRSYPVEVRYRPLLNDDEEGRELSLPQGVVAAVEELERNAQGMRGDVLVFLPGEKQIRETAKALRDAQLRNTEVLPLFARLSVAEQERIFAPHSQRRVVLATNVAETSLTVPGVHFVVDSGLARISRYSVRGKIQRLPIEPIAKASAEQRKGRCGRVAAGICIRLYSEDDFNVREDFTAPEILRTNLASVILKLAMLNLPDPSEFPFVDPPELKSVNDGYRLLQELKAVDEHQHITALGQQIAALPLDPRLARMLLAADHHRCLREMLIIAAFLSAQDPRERPVEAQQQADQHHASYADARSDFITVLKIWQRFHEQAENVSGNQLRKWCREQFLSFIRVREWQEVHSQLSDAADDLELRVNQVEANYADLHQAILSGFLGGIGNLEANREYLGARSMRFVVAPGTPLANKPPAWLVAANLVETTRTYARMVAAVEPQWIEAAGAHLLKRSYTEPHWEQQRGYVAAFESTALYGLTLSARRRVNYASVAPQQAREIFVRAALVENQSELKAEFLERNRALQHQVEGMEARIRRRDLLADEQTLVDFYLARLPESVHSLTAFNRWQREHGNATALDMTLNDLLRRDADHFKAGDYPDSFECNGNHLPLTYKFEPALDDDGAGIDVPLLLLSSLDEDALAWCVPGWRLEKVTELLRALPKAIRKSFVPVPQFAARALAELSERRDFSIALAGWIARQAGTQFNVNDLQALAIPLHLRIFISVVDLQGRVIATGRDLKVLLRETRGQMMTSAPVASASDARHRAWDFGELPVQREVQRNGLRLTLYPALEDRGDGVMVVELPSLAQAERTLLAGLRRLLVLALPQQYKFARQQFSSDRELLLLGQGIAGVRPLPDLLAERALQECFLTEGMPLPRTREDFEQLIAAHRSGLNDVVTRVRQVALTLFKELRTVRQSLSAVKVPAAQLIAEVESQLQHLLPPEFLLTVSAPWFGYLPRYLKAAARRIERFPGNAARDTELSRQVQPFVTAYERLVAAGLGDKREVAKLKWMIEEFRVSLFAQDLKTSLPVSAKRLNEQVEAAGRE